MFYGGSCHMLFNPPFLWKCLYQVRVIAGFPVFRLLTDFVCLLTYEICLSLWKIARCSVILLLSLLYLFTHTGVQHDFHIRSCSCSLTETHGCQISGRNSQSFWNKRVYPHFLEGSVLLHLSFLCSVL